MLYALIAAHVVLGALTPILVKRLGSKVFYVLSLGPLAAGVWLVTQAPAVLSGAVHVEGGNWIPMLDVTLTLRMGLVQWVLAMIVTWIGFLVLLYSRWYFEGLESGRSAAILTIFAGTMLGLVTADDLIMVYVFWELTTVFSFLLIGHDPTRRANRGAAQTALIVTTTGGLAMLLGIVAVHHSSGTLSLEAIVANPPTGTLAGVGAMLMLVGALSKSALVPFHFWLPGAMAAPTPISAYLHAAAMVKAGVYLVAVLAPVFAEVPFWRPTVLILGTITMVLGGWRALRQTDLKLLLAYGTVSQLGFMVLLLGVGTKAAALAGLATVIAHALFKSTLFMCVGLIDHSAGTRDIRELNGVGYRVPWLAALGGLAALSMAGMPPLVGFVTKEAAFESIVYMVEGELPDLTPLAAVAFAVALTFGAALTVAYSLRWWWGAFASKDGAPALSWHRPSWGMAAVPMSLGALSLVLGFCGPILTSMLEPYADTLPTGHESHGLALWHGFTWPLVMSALALGTGIVLFIFRSRIAAIQATFPKVTTAEESYHRSLHGIDRIAVEVTARVQRGSLSIYLGIILMTMVSFSLFAMLQIRTWPALRVFDAWPQLLVAIVIASAAVLAAASRGRIRAVLLVGVTGYGLAMLFTMGGAPDLALTQVLVETVTLIVFILVVRKLPRYFTNRPLSSTRWWRILLAGLTGATVTLISLVASGARVAEPVSKDWYEWAYAFGYGKNIVNVALVDTRAWDTLGEISVLVIAATGVASLIFLRSRVSKVSTTKEVFEHRPDEPQADNSPGVWLRAGQTLSPMVRSIVFEVVTRILFGVMIVTSVYLLLAGHNWPGGGFAGGLVAGTALMIRYLAAGRHELDEAAPIDAGRLMGGGLLLALVAAVSPLLLGGTILQSYVWDIHIPLLGELHFVSSTVFDIGVYLVVVGMILDVVRSLGSGIDQHASERIAPVPIPHSTKALPGYGGRS
ncbi:multisubunit sodium/proton antiporter, MrpA subunit (TC 2.A.63.1)/multisubunit sodium/proton antiporter, MrpB subunit (TC 2.A.63.1) [Tessaracoccus bendigoensis DSM 12906]|uniref:Multisubunit sodium/proton antiporter, MrpA subunit (TC 2.A.63.1)/multisubunit sodium/proton antiporter, MrpB subunit (TC 2.A.63.1) n=1 Tax=Tessaracoccus bendigoensis DSM 12906 TaxID=1123357 RepID=A0A1M6GKW7_9ACTN|nr:Na+/H+ antiporter subunit A [Tessaracoccus bendigoensis]SHJ10578.1 multisubunit sodium/proton antiporter, MrpA subunit (TC 2.A.63.1)/multisubunit sodium/proton antiporter, MrpB subunit (TC 2.A.63.1) [Tessaracoccus bendigoensis DSM 12906]